MNIRLGYGVTGTIGAAVFMSAAALPSEGAVNLKFATDQAMYTSVSGGTVIATVKLIETRDSASDTSYLESGNGLFGFDYAASRSSGTSSISDAAVASGLWTTAPNAVFSPTKPFPLGTSAFNLNVSTKDDVFTVSSGPKGNAVSSLVRELVLGTITVSVADNSIFTIANYTGSDNTLTWGTWIPEPLGDQVVLDALIAPAEFSVAVPEPATLAFLGLAGVLLVRRRIA